MGMYVLYVCTYIHTAEAERHQQQSVFRTSVTRSRRHTLADISDAGRCTPLEPFTSLRTLDAGRRVKASALDVITC
jgi:hypothetical protein